LFIILLQLKVFLFALALFDLEKNEFWNPFYFIIHSEYIISVLRREEYLEKNFAAGLEN